VFDIKMSPLKNEFDIWALFFLKTTDLSLWSLYLGPSGYLFKPTAKPRDRGPLQTISLSKNCSVGLN